MKMKHWFGLFIMGSALCLQPMRAPAVTVLLQDNFNAEALALNYAGFANWNVSNGTVDLIGNTNFFDLLPGNGRYVDLDGSTGNAGVLTSQSTFTFTPGTYELQFDLAGSQRGDSNTVTVALDSIYSEVFTFASSVPFTTIVRTIVVSASTSGTLSFDHAGGDNLGLLLDDVLLTRLDPPTDAAPIPEPGSLSLLFVGLSALLGYAWHRRSRRA